MKKSKGFTLIELLVVIAIIGILSAIVLVSLSGARDRARDARIQADMYQLRSVAETLFSADNNYSRVTTSQSDIYTLYSDIDAQNGTNANLTITTTSTAYCGYAQLNSGKYCCVDSQLKSTCNITTAPGNNDCTNSTNPHCP
jgi:general secretion pathway protein G